MQQTLTLYIPRAAQRRACGWHKQSSHDNVLLREYVIARYSMTASFDGRRDIVCRGVCSAARYIWIFEISGTASVCRSAASQSLAAVHVYVAGPLLRVGGLLHLCNLSFSHNIPNSSRSCLSAKASRISHPKTPRFQRRRFLSCAMSDFVRGSRRRVVGKRGVRRLCGLAERVFARVAVIVSGYRDVHVW